MREEVPFEEIDEYVRQHFRCSLMSDSKWKKLLNVIGDACESGFPVRYKLIHGESVSDRRFYEADEQFFIEPVFYKEVEWIEIYEEAKNSVGLTRIRNIIEQLGEFETEVSGGAVRVYGYK